MCLEVLQKLPVRGGHVELAACTGMHAQCACPCIECKLRYFQIVEVIRIPTGSDLHRNRYIGVLNYGSDNFRYGIGSLEQSAACTCFDDLRNRATAINIDDCRVISHRSFERSLYGIGIRGKKLDREVLLVIAPLHEHDRLVVAAGHAFAGYHLSIGKSRSMAETDGAVDLVGVTGQRGKKEIGRQFHLPDGYAVQERTHQASSMWKALRLF